MTDTTSDSAAKICCSSFYQSEVARMLLGDVFHPGGLELTSHLGEVLRLGTGDRVLDVACGRGASAVHLAGRFGCHVTGLDYGEGNVAAAEAHAASRGLARRTVFRQGDAESMPFEAFSFDAVVLECSFSTFADQPEAAAEMGRVLRSGGRLGLTDVTVNGSLPDEIQPVFAWVACLAGAGPPEHYVGTLETAGFTEITVEDRGSDLKALVQQVRRKLLGVSLLGALGKLDFDGLDLSAGSRLARTAIALIESGEIGYTLIAARKP